MPCGDAPPPPTVREGGDKRYQRYQRPSLPGLHKLSLAVVPEAHDALYPMRKQQEAEAAEALKRSARDRMALRRFSDAVIKGDQTDEMGSKTEARSVRRREAMLDLAEEMSRLERARRQREELEERFERTLRDRQRAALTWPDDERADDAAREERNVAKARRRQNRTTRDSQQRELRERREAYIARKNKLARGDGGSNGEAEEAASVAKAAAQKQLPSLEELRARQEATLQRIRQHTAATRALTDEISTRRVAAGSTNQGTGDSRPFRPGMPRARVAPTPHNNNLRV